MIRRPQAARRPSLPTVACAALAAALLGSSAADAAPRVYEQVSPTSKGASVTSQPLASPDQKIPIPAAAAGNALAYSSAVAEGDAQSAPMVSHYRSWRDPVRGWLTDNITIPMAHGGAAGGMSVLLDGFSADFAKSLQSQVGSGLPALAPDAQTLNGNMYVGHGNDAWELVTRSAPPAFVCCGQQWIVFHGASDDLSHVVFSSSQPQPLAPAVPDSPANSWQGVYEYADGVMRSVGVLPDGSPAERVFMPPIHSTARPDTAISSDGSRIFFQTGHQVSGAPLYLREADAPVPSTTAIGPGQFQGASADGSTAFFTSPQELTPDADIPPDAGLDLYRYDVDTGALTDVTVHPGGGRVLGVIGLADDGSSVYFAAHSTLVPGQGVAGEANVYRWHDDGTPDGAVAYVTTVSQPPAGGFSGTRDDSAWFNDFYARTARVSLDGRYLAISSENSLTGHPTAGTKQLYRYDAASGELECVSCNQASGGPSTHDATFTYPKQSTMMRLVQTRNLASDGTVFFQSQERLVADDRNDAQDVYEYRDGATTLVSGGRRNAKPSFFADASADGRDAFVLTSDRLLASDRDDFADVYDARIGGGFPYLPPVPECSGDGCQGAPSSAPDLRSPSTGPDGSGDARPGLRAVRSLHVARIGRDAIARFGRTGRLVVKVRVVGGGTVVARVRGRVGGTTKTVAIARRPVRSNAPKTVSLRLTLSRSARRALTERGRLRATLTVSTPGASPRRRALSLTRGRG